MTSRPLRVVLTCPYSLSVYGGVQLQVLGLARALRRMGVDARVLAPTDGPPPEPGVMSVGPTLRYPSNGSIAPITSGRAVASRTLESLRVFGPDVLHLHEPFSPGANHAALIGTDIPVVATFHAAYPGRNGWYDALRRPLRAVLERLAVRTAVSEEAQRNIEASLGLTCEILPNAVDVELFEQATPHPSTAPAIFFVGRHEERKGLGVLLQAFAGLPKHSTLWIAGSGPQTAGLRARNAPRVEWLGNISEAEKASRLRGATVACFPSLEGESFGIVLLEAMAAGTTVVASNLDGYRMVARDGREAVLVEPGDPNELCSALLRALTDANRRSLLVAAGKQRASEFALGDLAEAFVERYDTARHAHGVPVETERDPVSESRLAADRGGS